MMEMKNKSESLEPTPFDEILNRVREYVRNPDRATKDTMQELLNDLEELKPIIDSEGDGEDDMQKNSDTDIKNMGKPSLVIAIGHMMKKSKNGAMAACLVFLMAGFCESQTVQMPNLKPRPNSAVTEGIYVSSAINHLSVSSSPINGQNIGILISTKTCILHTVNISSPGTQSVLEIWNISTDTQPSPARRVALIDSTAKISFLYDIFLDSGLAIWNRGTTPAEAQVIFTER